MMSVLILMAADDEEPLTLLLRYNLVLRPWAPSHAS